MNKQAASNTAFQQYSQDVDEYLQRKRKEEDVVKQYGAVDPDSYDKSNKRLDKDIQKFKQSSEVMLNQLDEYERKKRELMMKNKGTRCLPELHPDIDRMLASKKKVPQEFLDKIELQLTNKQSNLERLQEEHEEEIDEKCPFVPAISNNSRAICEKKKIKPVYDRYEEELKAKKKRMEELKSQLDRQKSEQEEKENTQASRTGGKKYSDTYKHNIAWYNKKTQKIVEEQVKRLEEALQEKEHKPQVNAKSIKAMEGTNFEERQQVFHKRIENKRKELERKANNFSHSPNINQKSVKMAEKSKQKRLIKEMVGEIEANERKQELEAEAAEKLVFRDPSKSRPKNKNDLAGTGERLYKTPGKKKVIVTLPQKSRNPTVDKKDKSVKDLSSLRKTSPSQSPDRNALKSPGKSLKKQPEAGPRSVKFIEDTGDKPVVNALKDKGRLTRMN